MTVDWRDGFKELKTLGGVPWRVLVNVEWRDEFEELNFRGLFFRVFGSFNLRDEF